MNEELQKKMQTIMYFLVKNAAYSSYREFRESIGISDEDYEDIKKEWKEKLGITPYC
jgi:hypothetical protein